MTHLRIELAEGSTEYISSAGAKKLYELCKNSTFDNASNLQGTCHIQGGGYAAYKTYLETMFPNFHLTMDREYFVILDSEFEKVLALNWGDGTGITATLMLDVKDTTINNWIPAEILSNTSITDLTELLYCTGIAGNDLGNSFSWRTHFENMSSLLKIVFPNTITLLEGRYSAWLFPGVVAGMSYQGMNNLKYVDFNGIPIIKHAFAGLLPNLETVILGEGCTEVSDFMSAVSGSTKITTFTIPSTLQKLDGLCGTKITTLTIPGTVREISNLSNNTLLTLLIFLDSNINLEIYAASYINSSPFSKAGIVTLIFPDRPITFNSTSGGGFIGAMSSLTTVVFKRKPVSVDWSKFCFLTVSGYGTGSHINRVADIYVPDADYNDMVTDMQSCQGINNVTIHKLSDYPGTL